MYSICGTVSPAASILSSRAVKPKSLSEFNFYTIRSQLISHFLNGVSPAICRKSSSEYARLSSTCLNTHLVISELSQSSPISFTPALIAFGGQVTVRPVEMASKGLQAQHVPGEFRQGLGIELKRLLHESVLRMLP